ncbi:Zn-dependent alcohol dehydrogenase [Yinghuangia soli]|uniref:Zn-dependent alcohol dehydrogenase n=1 Tax=Yinghuangia soli TaxID=2908204 RepID=A0AA41PYQ5_9ACTN|nr:Zn-dependent alcohol dehydrogenase [Yinghuangia soli]MCF2528379.1 Zn-dependent alcohol dehydrogenase [Yinghuangia soli]
MKGVLFDGKEALVVDDLEVRDPGPNEVLVKIGAAGLCHSDISVINGTIPFPPPVVLGHEGAGIVESVGELVTHVAPGDHVALSTLAACGTCRECDRGRPTMCAKSFGNLSAPFKRGGKDVWSFAGLSVFTEKIVVKGVQAVKIPKSIPLASAALIGCGVLTGVGAVLNRAKVQPGDTVAVIGTGGIGLNVIQAAKLAGAVKIVAVDANPAKEAVAREFGATDFVDAKAVESSVKAVQELVPGGVDHAFECVGHVAVIRNAIDMLGRGGQAVILGVAPSDAEASFHVSSMFLDKSIMGCRYGSSRPQYDIARYADLYGTGALKLDELVTQTYALDDFHHAVEDAEAGKVARGVFVF